jgi:hypothetical protein
MKMNNDSPAEDYLYLYARPRPLARYLDHAYTGSPIRAGDGHLAIADGRKCGVAEGQCLIAEAKL